MRRVGIQELKQNASALIRRVVEGETIEVAKRGRPVARIVPLRRRSRLDQMLAEGRASQPSGDLLATKPKTPTHGDSSLFEILAEMRAGER